MKKILLIAFLFPFTLAAQDGEIAFGVDSSTCGASVIDSGGNGGDYGANENTTMTICPVDPEEVINLYFVVFDLGEGDTMTIYDGEDTSAPEIGQYSTNELQSQDIFNSIENTSGCLTLTFVSDANDQGNFAFVVSCGYPCERPEAIIDTAEEAPLLVCPGEEIEFDSSNSLVADGFSIIEWNWDFGDGEELASEGPVTSHSYENEGAYIIQLSVTDDNECTNANNTDLLVFVSNEPDFTGTSTDVDICLGQEVDLTGQVVGVLWDGTPDVDLGGQLFIPDDQDQCFESEINFSAFLPNATIESVDDFESFFINFEHSYMGDLIFTFICPNGQTIVTHSQGGGGTFLGVPVDNDGTPDAEGEGFDYFWSPDATEGTWQEESGGFGTLPSGSYDSVEPFEQLIGCPLNGTWSMEICDIFGSDNGFIFDWYVNFDPSLYPEPVEFTPIFGQECDSTSWSGPSITETSGNCNDIVVVPTETGTETYVFSATNNHGCTYEQIVNVNVVQGPIAATTEIEYWCGEPISLTGNIENPEAGTDYSFVWSPSESFVDPTAQNPLLQNLDEGIEYTVTVFPTDAPECASSSTVGIVSPPPPNIFNPDDAIACLGQVVNMYNETQPDGWNYEYFWTETSNPGEVLSNEPIFGVTESGTYQLQVVMNEPCFYSVQEEVEIIFESCEIGFVPNVISPNEDGKNDRFYVEGLDFFDGSTLQVYNRWGGLVYESENYNNNWSPTADDLADGTYYYILGVNFPTGMELFNGELTVLRK